MRPPMQSAALQQNEAARNQHQPQHQLHQHQHQHHNHHLHNQQQQHESEQPLLIESSSADVVAAAAPIITAASLGPLALPPPSAPPTRPLIKFPARSGEQHFNFARAPPPPPAAKTARRSSSSIVAHAAPFAQRQSLQLSAPRRRKSCDTSSEREADFDFDSGYASAIRLVDLSTSPPYETVSFGQSQPPPSHYFYANQRQQQQQRSSAPAAQRCSIFSEFSQVSRSSTSSDDEASLSAERLLHYTQSRANHFDDAAENFIINFPGDSATSATLRDPHDHDEDDEDDDNDDCDGDDGQLDAPAPPPLSETEPLLDGARQRSLCLSKNSGSLIFTRKEVTLAPTPTPQPPSRYYLPGVTTSAASTAGTAAASNNNAAHKTKRRQQASQRGAAPPPPPAGKDDAKRHGQTKHLPPTFQHQQQQQSHLQQQRRSLQLNYNNNLVTTAACGANNNYCCSGSEQGSSATTATHKHHHHHHHQHQHSQRGRSAAPLTSPTTTTAATTATATRKQHAYSWYAPVYSALEEELEQDSRDSSPIHNLANTKKKPNSNQVYQHQQRRASHNHQQQQQQQQQHQQHQHNRSSSSTSSSTSSSSTAAVADNDCAALLETRHNQINIQAQLHPPLGSAGVATQPRRPNAARQAPLTLPLQHALNAGDGGGIRGAGGASGGVGGGDFSSVNSLSSYDVALEGAHAVGSLGLAGGPLPRRRRLENFLKSLVGLKPSSGGGGGGGGGGRSSSSAAGGDGAHILTTATVALPASPDIKVTRTPSEQNLVFMRDPAGRRRGGGGGSGAKLASGEGSTASLNVVQQKLWNVVRREGSAASLYQEKSQSIVQYTAGLRKCETVLALTRQTHSLCSPVLGAGPGIVGGGGGGGSGIFSASGVEQIRPLNRLRHSVSSMNATCSRCSSLLSLAAAGAASTSATTMASGSRYSLNGATSMAARPPPQSRFSASSSNMCDGGGGHSVACSLRGSAGGVRTPPTPTTATAVDSKTPTPSSTPTCNDALLRFAALPPHAHGHSHAHSHPNTPTAAPLTVTSLLHMSPVDAVDGASPTSPSCSAPSMKQLQTPPQPQPQSQPPQSQSQSLAATCHFETFTCKLCLVDVESAGDATTLQQCGCRFCTECMKAYVEFEISEAAYEISCPDAQCPAQGSMKLTEIASLTTANLMKKHHRYRLNREIDLDKTRTWCPRAGCETVCLVGPGPPAAHSDVAASTSATSNTTASSSSSSVAAGADAGVGAAATGVGEDGLTPPLCAVQCPSCKDEFCSACKKTWHPNISCEEHSRRLVADGQDDIGIPFDNDLIKCCPMCAVPIEKDEGCAQMMCKRCKHVFCWYCLASLDDDFLLRHYDKGPCKNKLGHSRASVVWHRAQVIGIFAGFGILLLVASPLLLLAAPCIICCKCRSCSGSRIDEGDGDTDEATALQS